VRIAYFCAAFDPLFAVHGAVARLLSGDPALFLSCFPHSSAVFQPSFPQLRKISAAVFDPI
jgi:hypothetical protein